MEEVEVLLKGVLKNCGGKLELHQQTQGILMQYLHEGIRGNREAAWMQTPIFANFSLFFTTYNLAFHWLGWKRSIHR